MSAGNLLVVPKLIQAIGLANWNRGGCVCYVLAIIAIPSVPLLSWNDASLFAVMAATDTILFFSQGAVRERCASTTSTRCRTSIIHRPLHSLLLEQP